MSSEIPMDLLFREILSLLSSHDLLRYRCVCKVWRDNIDDPSFIRTHLDRQIINNGVLILEDCLLTRFYSCSLQSVASGESKIIDSTYLNHHPFVDSGVTHTLDGSCNSIILITNGNLKVNKSLWNPFTRHHRKLPPLVVSNKPVGSHHHAAVNGLGYDSTSDDYKVVHIDQFYDPNVTRYRSLTYIYSLKSDSWKRIKDFSWNDLLLEGGFFLNGVLHWIVTTMHCKLIAALDLCTEDYHEVALPCTRKPSMSLGVLNGCLALTCYYQNDLSDLWLLKDYEVGNSWDKLFSIRTVGILRPLTYFEDRERVLLQVNHRELRWLDLLTHSMMKVRICGVPDIFSCQTCVESLVRLDHI